MSEETNVSSGRARRERVQSKARVAALDKLKHLKGSKHKYEVSEVDNVYEEVDEREYSKRVRERQDDDWIIDDDGTGYVEDGRDIFDDDLDDESIIEVSHKRKRGGGSRNSKRTCLGNSSIESEKSNNIRSMLMNMPSKKEAPVKLEDDDVLGDIMQEMHKDVSQNIDPTNYVKCTDVISSEESAKRYLKNFTEVKRSDVLHNTAKNKINMENKCVKELSIVTSSPRKKVVQQSDLSTIDTGVSKSISKSLFHDANATKSNLEKLEDSASHDVLCAAMFQDDFTDVAFLSEEEEKKNKFNLNGQKQEEDSIETVMKAEKSKKHSCDSKEDTFLKDCPIVSNELPSATQLSVDCAKIPYTENAEGHQVLRFFWLDAHEDPYKQPGVVFLFGKVWIESVKMHVSCCLTVYNVERKVLVLPREKMEKDGTERDVTFLDVYKEFSEIASHYGIMEFRSRKVVMHNCFNSNVPQTSEYMEVKYPAHCTSLPDDLTGRTFSHVFGTGTNALERFLIEQHIKGPCWLDVREPAAVDNPLSWCKVEARVEKMEMVTVTVTSERLLPPSVVLLALQIKTVVNSKNGNNEIALAVGLVNRDFPLDQEPPANKLYDQHFAILAPLVDKPYPYDIRDCMGLQDEINVERMDSERALLSNLLAKVLRLDPDIIVGHDILGFDLEIILHQLLFHKVPNWSRLGRLRRLFPTPAVKKRLIFTRSYLCGRLPCDVMLAAKEHVQSVRSYDLETLCLSVLEKETHPALTFEEIRNHYESREKLKTLLKLSLVDAVNALQIMCHISAIPLALQITNIAGNVMSRTLIGGRAERNESLMLHAFYEKNFIPPEKNIRRTAKNLDYSEEIDKSRGKGRKKPNYSGGLVLEPKKGLYDKMILVMDFNSLYPSIIMEYNICFTTVTPTAPQEEDVLPEVPSKDLEMGILPAEIRKLVESRVMVRKLMQDNKLNPVERSQLHIRQIALKLMANSMYGCLGFSNARFYAKHLAALITAKGREILMNTKDIVESMDYEVIYGDTDSIMINTNCSEFDEVIKVGKQILQSVNKLYRCVNLDVDGVYKFMLLLKKKKYAVKEVTRLSDGTLVTKTKHKGLDIVRRDWSRLAVECGNFVVEQLLSDVPLEERLVVIEEHLKRLSEDLRAGRVPLPLLTITKQLTRSVEQYADAKSQPHVLVAKRLLQKGLCRMKAGDSVSYVICEDGTSNTPVQRAYHLDELKLDKNLKIDNKYYLAHQIHPVINRLLDPVEGTDAVRIAEILGLDPSPYQQAALQRETHSQEESVNSSDLFLHEPEHYEKCVKFSFMCVHCKTENVMDKPYKVDETGDLYAALSRCSNSQCAIPPIQYIAYIENSLTMLIRNLLQQYSKGVLVCEDPACPDTTRYVPQSFYRAYPICPTCSVAVMYKQMSDKELYTQFLFLQMVFDLHGSPDCKKIQVTPEVEAAYNILHNQVTSLLKHSFYSQVDLELLFKYSNMKLRDIKKALKSGVPSENLQSRHLALEENV